MDTLSLSGIIGYVCLGTDEPEYRYDIDVEVQYIKCRITINKMKGLSINRNIVDSGDSCEVRVSSINNDDIRNIDKLRVVEISHNGGDNYIYLLRSSDDTSVVLSFENMDKDIKKFFGGINPTKYFTVFYMCHN